MAKPANLAEWGTGSAPIVEPTLVQKQNGWTSGFKPPAQWFNWWMNLIYQWIVWLDAYESTAHTWTFAQTFNGTITSNAVGLLPGITANASAVASGGYGAVFSGTDLNAGVFIQASANQIGLYVNAGGNAFGTGAFFSATGGGAAVQIIGSSGTPGARALICVGGGNNTPAIGLGGQDAQPGAKFTGGNLFGDSVVSAGKPGNGIEAYGGNIYDPTRNAAAPGIGVYAKGGTHSNPGGSGKGGTGVKAVGGDSPTGTGSSKGYAIETDGESRLVGNTTVVGSVNVVADSFSAGGAINALIGAFSYGVSALRGAFSSVLTGALNLSTTLASSVGQTNQITAGLAPKAWCTLKIVAGVVTLISGQNIAGTPSTATVLLTIPLAAPIPSATRCIMRNFSSSGSFTGLWTYPSPFTTSLGDDNNVVLALVNGGSSVNWSTFTGIVEVLVFGPQ